MPRRTDMPGEGSGIPRELRAYTAPPHNFKTSVMRMARGVYTCEVCGFPRTATVHYGS